MARCSLDTSKPKFRKLIARYLAAHPSLQGGLDELTDKVSKDYDLCNRVNHPMPAYPQYQGKVWKWDFKPQGIEQSSTRKGWRLFAYVPDPKASGTVPAVAFLCYPKKDEPAGNPAKWVADALKAFLVEEVIRDNPTARFRRTIDSDGRTHSLCLNCCEHVFMSDVPAEIEAAEASHVCSTETPSQF